MTINFGKLDYGILSDNSSLDNLIQALIVRARDDDRSLGLDKGSRVYFASNEWHKTILDNIDFGNKRALGIIGSTDFMLSAINKGTKEFVGVDISLMPCLFAELKITGLKNLSYDDYIGFFSYEKPLAHNAFSESVYETKLRPDLSQAARAFFDKIIGQTFDYSTLDHTKVNVPLAFAFFLTPDCLTSFHQVIPYLKSAEIFYDTKRKLSGAQISLIQGDFLELISSKNKMQGEFDLIYASNIADCVNLPCSQFMQALGDGLSPQGKIIFYAYLNNSKSAHQLMQKAGFNLKEYKPTRREPGLKEVIFPDAYVAWKK